MTNSVNLFGQTGFWVLGLYLLLLLLLGLKGRYARKADTLEDFYLAGREFNLWILLLTLYATQYSGNTLVGFAGSAYREGFRFLVSYTFMASIIGAYFLFAPKLFRLARQHRFITPGDYFQWRFQNRALTATVTLLGIFALANYILTNLKAMGNLVETATGGEISFLQGILLLSLVMVIYESLGGMRSVAWTDAIQGILLLLGCIAIFTVILFHYDGLSQVSAHLIEHRPDLWNPPSPSQKITWLSTLILVFFGIALYPHSIQRIYAARSVHALKRSLQWMVFLPFFTTFFMILVGIVGIVRFQNLSNDDSERITLLMLTDMVERVPAIRYLVILFLCAAIAAIMSTIDSALLSISSMFTQDFYRNWRPNLSQSRLTAAGKWISWTVMALMAWFAIYLPQTIWQLVQLKLELLCQIAPGLFLGIHWKSLNSKAVLSGVLIGALSTIAYLLLSNAFPSLPAKPLGIHAGVLGFLLNLITLLLVQKTTQTSSKNS